MTTPAEQTVYSYVSTGIATYTIPMWIFQQADIAVFYNGAEQDPGDFTVAAITEADFSLTLAVPPLTGVEISVARDVIVSAPTDFSPGAPLTAADLNYKFDIDYIIENDTSFYGANIVPKYDISELVDPTDPLTAQDLTLPKLSTPGVDESPRCWAKDSAGEIIDAPLDSSGISAAELKAELAVDTSALGAGATLVGYYDADIGGITVQEKLDLVVQENSDNQVVADGMQNLGGTSVMVTKTPPTDPTSTYGTDVFLGDQESDFSSNVDFLIKGSNLQVSTGDSVSGLGDASAFTWLDGSPDPIVPATGNADIVIATKGFVNEVTSDVTSDIEAKLDILISSLYPIGRIMYMMSGTAGYAGLPTIPGYLKLPQLPNTYLVASLSTFGNAASGATFANDDYEDLYKKMWSTSVYSSTFFQAVTLSGWVVFGGHGASADADWTANKKLYIQPITGINLASGAAFYSTSYETAALNLSVNLNTGGSVEGSMCYTSWPYICFQNPT